MNDGKIYRRRIEATPKDIFYENIRAAAHRPRLQKVLVGDLVWYDRVTGEPKYDIIGERLGISGDKVKVSFQAWRNAGNTPPGNIAGRAASNVSQNLQNQQRFKCKSRTKQISNHNKSTH